MSVANKGAEIMILLAITTILIVLIVCITFLIYTFIDNSDNYSIWRIEKQLDKFANAQQEILKMLKEQK